MAVGRLSEHQIAAGAAMMDALDSAGIEAQIIGWVHFHNLGDWRLIVASDLLPVMGRAKLYDAIDAVLAAKGPVEGLTVFDVHLAALDEYLPSLAKGPFRFEQGPVVLNNSTVNGVVMDAHMYRGLEARSMAEVNRAAQSLARNRRVMQRA